MPTPIKSFTSNILTEMATTPLAMIAGIIIADLSTAEKGIYSFILIMLNLIISTLLLGIPGGVKYYISNISYEVKEVFFTVITFGALYGLVFTAGVFTIWKLGFFFEMGSRFSLREISRISFFCLPLTINIFLNKILEGKGNFIAKNRIYLAHILILLGLIIYFLIYKEQRVSSAFFAFGMAHLFVTGALLLFITLKYGFKIRLDFNYLTLSIKYGVKVWPTEQLTRITGKHDQIFLGFFFHSGILGVYSVAYAYSELVSKISNAIIPIFFNQVAANDNKKFRLIITLQVLRIVMSLQFLVIVFLAVVGFWLIPTIYGNNYKGAISLMLIILPSFMFYAFSQVIIQYFSAINMPFKGSTIKMFGYAVGIPLTILLVLKYNSTGAAVAHLIGSIILGGISYYQFASLNEIKLKEALILKKKDIKGILSLLKKGKVEV